ncbi:MAG TPA: cupin domain-containing protein [Solirubrobacteraceae bacterium]|nr:cupin domain-containing protein [Solirubrobacteraceae bacterium]
MPDDQAPTLAQGTATTRLDLETDERFLPLRRQLGVSSFGINQIAMAPGQRGRIHRHERQEEVYLVLEGTLTLVIEGEESDLGEDELIRVAPGLRRQLVNRGPGRLVLLAFGGEGEHRGRDGEAFVSWDAASGASPQETPPPADLDPAELRTSAQTPPSDAMTGQGGATTLSSTAPAVGATASAEADASTLSAEAAAAGDEAVACYLRASSANDIDALLTTLAPGAELVSPISGRMVFRGERDLRALASAVYGSLRGLSWGPPIGRGRVRLAIGEGRVAGARIADAMVFELDEQGRIARVRPHLRPWLGLTVFALAIGPRMARHPGVVLRALRAP